MDEVLVLPGMEGQLNALDEAQLRSAEARRIFEVGEGSSEWMDDYWRMVGEGWPWRQAVYMLWAALPGDARRPRTQEALAVEVLGLTSDRQIRKWRENPALDAEVARLAASALSKARANIYQALVESATNPNPRAHADRKLALEMLGDYVPRQVVRVGQELPDDLSELSEEELRQLRAGPVGRAPEGMNAEARRGKGEEDEAELGLGGPRGKNAAEAATTNSEGALPVHRTEEGEEW